MVKNKKKKKNDAETDVELASVISFGEDGEPIVFKNCAVLKNFYFSKMDLFLTRKNGKYRVCIPKDGELYSFWSHINSETNIGEVLSIFRKSFMENKITPEMVDKFFGKPKKYAKACR